MKRTCLALLTVHAALLAWQAWRKSPTIDEPAHLVAGLSHWKFGRFDIYRVNPPLVHLVASLPLLLVDPKTDWINFSDAPYSRSEFSIGSAFADANGFETFWYFTLARWACIPFSLAGGYFCYRWARELYGSLAGIWALVLWCFCPNIFGNGALITPDAGAAALGVAAGYYFWRWLRQPGWKSALVAGLMLGLAELTKSTWIILFALWPLLWLAWKVPSHSRQFSIFNLHFSFFNAAANPKSQIPNPKFTQLTAILLIALYILNLGYGFENSFERLDKFDFISRALGGAEAHLKPGNRFAGTWLAVLPVPVPANYLQGIDTQRYDFERQKWSYLRGEQKVGGWWHYYIYAMAVKIPLGTLLLIGLTCATSGLRVLSRFRRPAADQMPGITRINSRGAALDESTSILRVAPGLDVAVLLAPAVVVLVLVSSQTGFNRYLRYVLPVFPFLFIWTSQLATSLSLLAGRSSAVCRKRRASLTALALIAFCASIASSLSVFPHSLSYFNELAGGPANGPAHLLDANVDWGQDLLELKRWHDSHPDARPLFAAYFNLFDSSLAGIESHTVHEPSIAGIPTVSGSAGPSPGWYALSVNRLYGYKHSGDEPDCYAWLRQFQPAARAGYSIYIYRLESQDVRSMADWLPQSTGSNGKTVP